MKFIWLYFGITALMGWAGVGLNHLVFWLNGGMPFPVAYATNNPKGYDGTHIPLMPTTRLPFLADNFESTWGWVSIGDVLLFLALVLIGVGAIGFSWRYVCERRRLVSHSLSS